MMNFLRPKMNSLNKNNFLETNVPKIVSRIQIDAYIRRYQKLGGKTYPDKIQYPVSFSLCRYIFLILAKLR